MLDKIVIGLGAAASALLICIIIYGLAQNYVGEKENILVEAIDQSISSKPVEAIDQNVSSKPVEAAKGITIRPDGVNTVCIDGVTYFWAYISQVRIITSPKFDADSKVVQCTR